MSAGVATPPAKILPQKNLNVRLICKRCQVPTEIVERFAEGSVLCGECGLVLGVHIIDTRSECTSANFEDGGDDPSRVGAAGDPLLGGINQLEATVISARDGLGFTQDLSRINNKIQGQRQEKHLAQAFKHIQSMAEHMNLAKIVIGAHIPAVEVSSKMMNQMVVNLMKNVESPTSTTTQQQQPMDPYLAYLASRQPKQRLNLHASDESVSNYCSLLRPLLRLALDHPSILSATHAKVHSFLSRDLKRQKDNVPDLLCRA
ncbi:transcription initiation factor IIB [Rhizophlyctis rosea]|nr:transcription initiation factor IIB [Rhizophlyctis rosea]